MQNVTVELGQPSPNQYFGDWILNRTYPGKFIKLKKDIIVIMVRD